MNQTLWKYRLLIPFLFLGLFIGSAYNMQYLEFDFSFDAFIPEDDNELDFYQDFKTKFPQTPGGIMAGLYREEGIFDQEFLERSIAFERECKTLEHIQGVNSLNSLSEYIYDPVFPIWRKLLHYKDSTRLAKEETSLLQDHRVLNQFISSDGKMLMLYLMPDSGMTKKEHFALSHELYELMEKHGFEGSALAGHQVFSSFITWKNEQEFKLYVVLALLVILISITILFRRFWGIVIGLASVVMGMVLFFGGLAIWGKPLDLTSSLYPILMVIVGTSDVVHIMSKYVDELRKGTDKQAAIVLTIKEIGLATFMTSLTTAIGFVSLYASHLPPIKTFGLTAAVGVFVAYLTVISFTVTLITFFDAAQLIHHGKGAGFVDRLMQRINVFTRTKAKTVALVTIGVIGLTIWGMFKISLNIPETRDLPRKSRVLRDYNLVEEHMVGIGMVDFAVNGMNGLKANDWKVLREMDRLENHVFEKSFVGAVHSPLLIYKLANQSMNAGASSYYTLPEIEKFDANLAKLPSKIRDGVDQFISDDKEYARFNVKIRNIGSMEAEAFANETLAWAENNLDSNIISLIPTGPKYIFNKHQAKLAGSLMRSLLLAFFMVSVFMALVFRNLRMLFISFVPNLIPLCIAGAVIGFMDIRLDASVAIIFTISFGIAVDDTIHFLSKYKLERLKGKSGEDAIATTFAESGKAIVFTTFILFFGFLSLSTSAFPPTYIIGSLISITLLTALISDLFLIPLGMRWLLKEFKKKA